MQKVHRAVGDGRPAAFVQAKLSVSEPHDPFEREADRVADEVMRMPDPQAAPPRIQRLCSSCEEDLQRKAGEEGETHSSDLESYVARLPARGEPLAPSVRDFFEPRFGVDLSAVRVHRDAEADRSARSIDALAYTAGSDIVFAAGRYDPSGAEGRRLLAHELTHVVQQAPGRIQRTASFQNPTPIAQDPLARVTQGLSPGLTTVMINGRKMANLQEIIDAVAPENAKQAGKREASVACVFDGFDIHTGAEQIIASDAPKGGWKARVPAASLGPGAAQCPGGAPIAVTMNAQPSNEDFVKRVRESEDEHVADIKVLHERHFVPYERFINGLAAAGPDLSSCAQNLAAQIQHRHQQAAYAFFYGWVASQHNLDDPRGTHADRLVVTASADCASASAIAIAAHARIPGAGPGNVLPVKATVTKFAPGKLKVKDGKLMEGSSVVKSFTHAADAQTALAVIQHYGMDSRHVIGPLEYFLAVGAAPSGSFKGASEVEIDPARYQVTLGLPADNDWAITDTAAVATGISVNVVANFGANRDEAYSAWEALRRLGFRFRGWIGGTRQVPEMMYFRV